MGNGKPGSPALTPEQWREADKRQKFYDGWKRTSEAMPLRPPDSYNWLIAYPNNFKRVRGAFHVAWITHRMTQE